MKTELVAGKFRAVVVILAGSAELPLDALRYSVMVPATEADAHAMERDEYGPTGVRVERMVSFRRFFPDGGDPMPKSVADRLKSMGWRVVSIGGVLQ